MQKLAIGLTGSIASGKSFILNIFKKYDFAVLDTDDVVHDLMKNDKNIKKQIKDKFPDAFVNNEIDRKKLGKIVFSGNLKNLKTLEDIVHPAVIEKCKDFIKENKNKNKNSIIEVPLLFESGMEKIFDKIITIVIEKKLQKEILEQQRNITEKMYEAILLRQMPISEKEKRADMVIYNTLDEKEVTEEIKKIIASF